VEKRGVNYVLKPQEDIRAFVAREASSPFGALARVSNSRRDCGSECLLYGDPEDGAQHDQRVDVVRSTGSLRIPVCPLAAVILGQIGQFEFRDDEDFRLEGFGE